MWGEFEGEPKEVTKCDRPESPILEQSHKLDTPSDTEETEVLPLRDRIIQHLASSSVTLKSQQRYEPDLTYKEREVLAGELLEKPGQFLYRFGKHLQREHFQYFLKYEGDPEVDHYVAESLKQLNKHTAKITVRNRRYAAMQELRRSGNYFSEKEMERRNPLLYDQLIACHQTEEERRKYEDDANVADCDVRFSSLLLEHIDNCSEKYLKNQQKEEEDMMFEEEDTDEEVEEEDEDELEDGTNGRKKQLFREEFYSSLYHDFIRGQDPEFDYGQVDASDTYDLLDIRTRDEEERYFDDDDDDTHDSPMNCDDGTPRTSSPGMIRNVNCESSNKIENNAAISVKSVDATTAAISAKSVDATTAAISVKPDATTAAISVKPVDATTAAISVKPVDATTAAISVKSVDTTTSDFGKEIENDMDIDVS